MMMMTEMGDQKRRNHHDGFLLTNAQTEGGGDYSAKKMKTARPSSISPKEKKDKVGERVAALQQLVSPFGKTDTASVLQETTEYIKFLHDQLQVLSAPYLRTGVDGNMIQDGEHSSLRSRGLCLMPIDSTLQIAQNNGADMWAPANCKRRGEMKIQCDACEKAAAVLVCCADEAALCEKCDVEIHAANKLASKHQRLLLHSLSNHLPRCDICQEKSAFIFCVEDRALFCRGCDESIHIAGSLSGNHQRYLATGIRVDLSSMCNKDSDKGCCEPPNQNFALSNAKVPTIQASPSTLTPSAWAVDDFLQLSDYESGDKKRSPVGFGELDWFEDIGLLHEDNQPLIAEVPELPKPHANNGAYYKNKAGISHKKPRIEISDDEEYFTVPDLG